MRNKSCVTTTSKEFKSLSRKYNISSGDLELAMKSLPDAGNNMSSKELEGYVNSYFKLNTTIPYSSKGEYDKALGVWNTLTDTINNSKITTSTKAKKLYNKIASLYGKDNTILYTDNDGNFKISISKPVLSNDTSVNQPNRKTYKGMINSLKDNQIFVFGSNTQGRHGAGAAKTARDKFGAKYGQAEGIQGKSFAIITKDLTKDDGKNPSRTRAQIEEQIHQLYEYARQNPNKEFLVAYSSNGRNLNYYSNEDMASMFVSEDIPSNIVFEEGFNELVNKASSTSSRQKSTTKSKKTTDTSKLQKATDTLNRIIEDTEEHITFDPSTHEYFVDGKKVDMSVTQYIHGNSSIDEKWTVPSTRIGNTVDRFVRAYFKGEDVFSLGIPNLSHEGAVALKEDLDKLKSYFDKKFGVNNNGNPLYKVITDEIHITGKYRYINDESKSVTKTIAGTPDMIIIDKDGNFHILDMKTKRTNVSSIWGQDTERSYYQQVSMYKAILEASYPELKGKIKDMNLIRFDVKYPTPSGITNQYGDDIGIAEYDGIDPEEDKDYDIDTLYVTDDTMDHYVPIEDYDGYSSPRLSVIANNGLFKVSEIKPEGEVLSYNTLSPDEKSVIDEEIGDTSVSNPAEQTEAEKQVNELYNPGILPASERIFLGNTAMSYVSFLITQLQTSPEANSTLFGDEFSSQDFTKMSREDIVNTIKVSKLLNYVKERYFNPDNRVDIDDFDVLDKLQVAYDNWGALIQSAYSKLISLENTTVIKTAPNEINTEDLDADDTDWMEGATLEEKEREYYQLGQRQISARSSLSADIKRAFERLPVVDKEGNYLADKYGYKFITFVDAGEATNRIFDWVQDCTSIDEMENILKEKSSIYPWLNNIIDKIQKEPFRSLFYQNFRKPFTKYSIVTVKKDADGNRSYEVNVINTKGASEALLDGIVNAYNSGIVNNIIIPIKGDLEGKGRVNVDKVQELKELNSSVISKLQKAHSDRRLNRVLPSEIDNIAKLLTDIGVPVESNTLKEAFDGDSSRKNFNNTNVYSVLNEVNYLLSTVLDNKKNKEYNPLEKGIEGNIYGNYRNIIGILSKYIQDSIESSTYENGKMHYSFTTPSYMSKLVTNLKNALGDPVKFKKFIQKEYGSYRFFKDGDTWKLAWLDKLANSKEARQQFDYKVQLAFDGTPYTDLSEVGYTLSLLSEYFYDKGTKARNKKLAWFRIPMLANKPSSEFIRFTRYTGRNYKRYITEGLRDVFDQEVMRIQTVLERAINPNVNKIGVKDKITFDLKNSMVTDALKRKIRNKSLTINDFVKKGSLAFHGSGAEFKFLEALNNEFINKTELGQMIIDKINGKDVNEAVFNKKFSEAINNYMDIVVDNEMKNWESIGLFDKETREVTDRKGNKDEKTVYKYLDKLGIGESEDEIKGNLEEYVWNDLFATINIIELTATDLAYYKNVEDFQKRYAQVHSPAMRLNVSARDANGNLYAVADPDGTVYERTIYLKDNIKVSDIIPNIEKALNDRIATLSGQEKNYMKMMKDLIISSFKEVNVADAQGYSSPTSYRKKLGMMGRWTTDMEEAYERITSGNYNVNDLGVVWQPLKPFVYSQIRKPSGASAMSELKVPVQNKNSEYLLFLADAIMRGNKQNNKLIAIFDFMEDSAWDGRVSKEGKVIKKGVYNGRGIDTVQFESAVNSGSMGAIDLNDLNTYDEVKEALNNAVYYNDDREYNDQYVHAIPFEDYGIQQEVPAHLVDHEQLMGSQVRILSISDMTSNDPINVNGEEIAPSDLVDEYQNLIAENIRDSFNQLIKDFHLKGNRAEKNRALSNLLTEAILKDQRYGSDLLRACSLNEEGEFVIPINDPVQSIRIQQLLNSIIKTRINKQKVKGGPVVQASSFGLSENLNIRFKDKDGNILDTFEEFKKKHRTSKNIKEAYDKYLNKNQYSIAYFECYMPIPSESLEKALTKKDGTLMSMEEAVSKGIITEDMRKAIGYRIPTEDKYSMAPLYIKGFLPKAAGEAIMFPKEVTTLSGSDFDIDKLYIMLKSFEGSNRINWKQLREDMVSESGLKDEAEKKYRDKIRMAIDEIVHRGIDAQFPGESFEIERKVLQYYKDNSSKYDYSVLGKRDIRNNRIFDLQWAVLTSPDVMSKMFNPGSFDVQKRAARIVNILKSKTNKYSYGQLSSMSLDQLDKLMEAGSNRNILLSSTQVYFHKQNMTAGKLIGVFANNNTSHAFLSMQNITLDLSDGGFMFDGYKVDSNTNNKLDSLYSKDGSLISKTIAGFLAASVDAVKDPVLNFMNLNTFTANTAMLLARLGFDTDSIGMFLTQPIIEKVTREYFKRSNEGYVTADEVINEFLPKDASLVDGIRQSLISTPFTKEDLAEGLMNGNSDTDFQVSALILFQKLTSIAQDLNTLTFLTKFNSVTNAVGPTIADTLVMRERYRKFIDKMDTNPPFNDEARNVINNNPILKAFFDTTVRDGGASELIFKDYFPHYGGAFTSVLDRLRQNVKGQLDSKLINKLVNDFMYYKLTLGNTPVIDGSEETRRKYINDFTTTFSKESEGVTNNDFLKILRVKSADYRCPVSTIESKTGGYSVDVQERVKSAWSDLINNPSTRKLGLDMFFYNIYRNGFGFSPKTAGHLASVDVRLSIPGYVDTIRNVEFNDNYVSVDDFIYMFLRNHSNEFKLVPRFSDNDRVKINEDNDVNGNKIITFAFDKKKHGMDSIIVSTSSDSTTFAPVIMYNDKLYMKPNYTEGDTVVTYVETTPLGNTNNFLEYGEDGAYMKSVLNKEGNSVSQVRETPDKQPTKDTPDEPEYRRSFSRSEVTNALSNLYSDSELRDILGKYNADEKEEFTNELVDRVLDKLNVDPDKFGDKVRELIINKLKEVTNKVCG